MMNIEQYLDKISKENFDKSYYFEKIKKYRNECGCALSAFFLVASLVILCGYIYFIKDWSQVSLVKLGLFSFSFILLSAFAGKLIGLGLAKIKLKLLYKKLIYENYNS